MKKILVTGGSGYKGALLIKKLLNQNYYIINIDINLFGNLFLKHKNVKNYNIDIRDVSNIDLTNVDACIHLASIANDPMTEINPSLSWETSVLGTKILIESLIKYKVKNLIYASSGSVYGIKKEKLVTEDLKLEPISTYNKVKMVTERVIMSYKDKINSVIIRPATVCGFSPRMRLDVTVNMLTYQALKYKKITVFGGFQKRPNIHIDDILDVYLFFLKKKINGTEIYNAGFENLSILQIAKIISRKTGARIKVLKNTNDKRSYNLDSSKLLSLGYTPKKNISSAIDELKDLYNKKIFVDKPNFHSIKWLKKKFIDLAK